MTGRVLVVQHETECPPALLGDWLTAAGCELDVRHPYAGDALPTLESYDGLLVLGGAMSAHDDEVLSWISPTKDLVRDARSEGVPTLGVCLGHQLAAEALGGLVEPNPHGQQVGVLPVGWTPEAAADPLFADLVTPRRGVQWNNDVVTRLPDGATVLAATARGEVQVVRFGPSMWGVQLHPEVDAAILASWVTDTERETLAGRGLDADTLVEEVAAARAELERAWSPLATGFAAIVQGTAVDPHRSEP